MVQKEIFLNLVLCSVTVLLLYLTTALTLTLTLAWTVIARKCKRTVTEHKTSFKNIPNSDP